MPPLRPFISINPPEISLAPISSCRQKAAHESEGDEEYISYADNIMSFPNRSFPLPYFDCICRRLIGIIHFNPAENRATKTSEALKQSRRAIGIKIILLK